MRYLRQIGGADKRGIFLPARAAADDERPAAAHEICGHRRFHAHLVDGVDNEVERPSENRFQIVFIHKILDFLHLALRIDLQDAFVQRRYLRLAEIVGQRMELAVDVGLGHIVQVNQRQPADTRARQRLDRPRTDAAHADHADMRLAETLQRIVAVQPRDAAETA